MSAYVYVSMYVYVLVFKCLYITHASMYIQFCDKLIEFSLVFGQSPLIYCTVKTVIINKLEQINAMLKKTKAEDV